MSSFYKLTKHPITGEWDNAAWLDNYFGQHRYGVKFKDGIYDADDFSLETKESPIEKEHKIEHKLGAQVEELWDWCATEVLRLDNGVEVWKKINEAHRQALGGENE